MGLAHHYWYWYWLHSHFHSALLSFGSFCIIVSHLQFNGNGCYFSSFINRKWLLDTSHSCHLQWWGEIVNFADHYIPLITGRLVTGTSWLKKNIYIIIIIKPFLVSFKFPFQGAPRRASWHSQTPTSCDKTNVYFLYGVLK